MSFPNGNSENYDEEEELDLQAELEEGFADIERQSVLSQKILGANIESDAGVDMLLMRNKELRMSSSLTTSQLSMRAKSSV